MINNIGIIIKKRIGGKYVTLLGDFDLESSEKVFCNFFIFIFLQNIPNVQTPYNEKKTQKLSYFFFAEETFVHQITRASYINVTLILYISWPGIFRKLQLCWLYRLQTAVAQAFFVRFQQVIYQFEGILMENVKIKITHLWKFAHSDSFCKHSHVVRFRTPVTRRQRWRRSKREWHTRSSKIEERKKKIDEELREVQVSTPVWLTSAVIYN